MAGLNSKNLMATYHGSYASYLENHRALIAFIGGTKPSILADFLGGGTGQTFASIVSGSNSLPFNDQSILGQNPDLAVNNLSLAMPITGGDTKFSDLAGGSHDADFTHVYSQVNSCYPNTYYRLDWEFNIQSTTAGGNNDPAWTSNTDFINLWKRVVGLARAISGFNGKFVFNPTLHYNSIYPPSVYPGDAYVDVVAVDPYDQWSSTGAYTSVTKTVNGVSVPDLAQRWAYFMDDSLQWLLYDALCFANSRGKPIAFPEWGCGDSLAGACGDNPLYMRNMLRIHDWHPNFEYSCYWDYPAPDGNCAISNGHNPRSGQVFQAHYEPRGVTSPTATGMPTVVQSVPIVNGAAVLANPTPGNVMVAVIGCDNDAGVGTGYTGFDANGVGLDMGTAGWRIVGGPQSGPRGIAALVKPVPPAGYTLPLGCTFTAPAGWRGGGFLLEVANFASASLVQGVATSAAGGVNLSLKTPTNILPLLIAQTNSQSPPQIASNGSAINLQQTQVIKSTGYYHSVAMCDLMNSTSSLAISGRGMPTPIYSTLMLHGRDAAPAAMAPNVIQHADAGGLTASLPANPTLKNTVIAFFISDGMAGAGGVQAPQGWELITEACPGTQTVNLCAAKLRVTDPTDPAQNSATFIAPGAAGHTYILELPGNVHVEAVSGKPYPTTYGSSAAFTYPLALIASNALMLWAWMIVGNAPTVDSSQVTLLSATGQAKGVCAVNPSATSLTLTGGSGGIANPGYLLLTVTPN